MTPSKIWALVLAFFLVAAGTVGAAYWRHQHPDGSAPAALAALLPTAPSSPPAAVPAPATPVPTANPQPPSSSSAATPSQAAPPPDAKAAAAPSFDIVRVEPKGDAVVAGKGAPNADVALMAGGKVVGKAKADANGQFVILPPALKPGDYNLTLRQSPDGKPASDSTQSVVVSVPKPGKGSVVVALAEPGKATQLLSPPPAAPEAVPAPQSPVNDKVAIHTAELENGNGFYATGSAKPGTPVHLYLNDSHIADVVAGADGQWSVRVKKGLTGGHYVVRADAGEGRVLTSRAEVPFDVPMAMGAPPAKSTVATASTGSAAATAPSGSARMAGTAGPAGTDAPTPSWVTPAPARSAAGAAAPTVAPSTVDLAKNEPRGAVSAGSDAEQGASGAATPGQDAVVDEIATARVVAGDNLWDISRVRLGNGLRYTQIYAANANQIRDPNLIYPGQVFVVPEK